MSRIKELQKEVYQILDKMDECKNISTQNSRLCYKSLIS